MMRTLCPACGTAFRVTPEQLKARLGTVRCGQCRSQFNALEALADEAMAVGDRYRLRGAGADSTGRIALPRGTCGAAAPIETRVARRVQHSALPNSLATALRISRYRGVRSPPRPDAKRAIAACRHTQK